MNFSLQDKKKKANAYRKDESYDEAIQIYRELWDITNDAYDGAGLLSCYRKKKDYKNALSFANVISKHNFELDWVKQEICWTYIQAEIQLYPIDAPLELVIRTAKKTLEFNPDFLARKLIVFKVLKSAKHYKNWKVVKNWVDLIEYDKLSNEPISQNSRKEGWSDRCLWFNYKIKSLIENGNYELANKFSIEAEDNCAKKKIFFLRFKAIALKNLGKTDEALNIYKSLCNINSQWWMFSEYGIILKEAKKYDEALSFLCKAALSNKKREMMINIYPHIAEIFIIQKKYEFAIIHYYLEKKIREEKKWNIPKGLINNIEKIDIELKSDLNQSPLRDVFFKCNNIWKEICNIQTSNPISQRNLIGKLSLLKNKPYSFVNNKEGLSAICFIKTNNINNGDSVIFDVEKSYDHRKKRDSWKVVRIKKYNK